MTLTEAFVEPLWRVTFGTVAGTELSVALSAMTPTEVFPDPLELVKFDTVVGTELLVAFSAITRTEAFVEPFGCVTFGTEVGTELFVALSAMTPTEAFAEPLGFVTFGTVVGTELVETFAHREQPQKESLHTEGHCTLPDLAAGWTDAYGSLHLYAAHVARACRWPGSFSCIDVMRCSSTSFGCCSLTKRNALACGTVAAKAIGIKLFGLLTWQGETAWC